MPLVSGAELDPLLGSQTFERFGRDQRQRLSRLGAVIEVVAVADEPLARVRLDALDRRRHLAGRSDIDLFDAGHVSSLATMTAATRRLDRDDVAGTEIGRHLRR